MKMTLAAIPVVVALATLHVCADHEAACAAGSPGATSTAPDSLRKPAGSIVNSKKLNGAEVMNPAGEKLGKVHELAVDLEAGRVVEVILSVGGVLGIGERLVAIPPSALSMTDEAGLRLATDRERLKSSEEFNGDRWAENFMPAQVSRTYREYDVDTYFLDPSKPAGAIHPSAERIGFVEKASKLIGFTIKNKRGETLGKVDDLAVDLAAGRVAQVIVSAGGLIGGGYGLNFIPPSSFRYNRDRSELELNVEKESLTWVLRFTTPEETDLSVRPGGELTPPPAGSPVDAALTRKIRTVISQANGLSVNAQNIRVISRNGRLTLLGPVESDSEKTTLGELASRYVVPENIDNRLDVNPVSANR